MAKTPDEDKLLNDMKSLVGEAEGGDFSVDDILAEFGIPPRETASASQPPKKKKTNSKILAFPSAKAVEVPEEEPEIQQHTDLEADPLAAFAEEEDDEALDALFGEGEEEEDNVVDFPQQEEEGVFSGLLRKIDRQADKLFETDDEIASDEVHRLERLIPGTDYEEEYEEEEESIFQRLRREPPPPEDIPPRELAHKYYRGLFSLRLRGTILLILSVVGLLPLVHPLLSVTLPIELTADPSLVLWFQAGLLAVGMVLSVDLILISLWRGIRLKIGADTLLTVAAAFTLADGIYLAMHPLESRPLSYCSIALVALWIQMHGAFHKRMAQHISCHTASVAKTPYLVTLDEKKWNAKDTYCKWSGVPIGFGSQMQMDDGGQRFFALFCPLLLVGCGFIIVPVWTGGSMASTLWTASATLLGATALGAPLCYGRSARKLEQRLEHSGATLAGWAGVKESGKGSRVLLTDSDLFPAGTISLKQPSFFRNHSDSKVVAYTACLMSAADCGLTPLFENYLRSYGGIPRKIEKPLFHEGGGISGRVWHDDVLVGSASFMNLMNVPLQAGMYVNQSVFCAINGELAGVFPLNYVLPETVSPAVYTLLGEDIAPILATRDFNLIPAFLSGRFRLPAEDMDFPVIERRRELSQQEGEHNDTITAVLCREGLLPFSEAVVAAKRLRIATRVGGGLCVLGSVLGILLTGYLTSVEAYTSASPLNLLVFLVLWLLPVWFLTEWSHRF